MADEYIGELNVSAMSRNFNKLKDAVIKLAEENAKLKKDLRICLSRIDALGKKKPINDDIISQLFGGRR